MQAGVRLRVRRHCGGWLAAAGRDHPEELVWREKSGE